MPHQLRILHDVAARCAPFIEVHRRLRAERRAREARDEALAVVAHDLRSPIATIVAQSALDGPGPRDPRPSPWSSAEVLGRAVARMSRIIDGILDVTRIDAGVFQVDPRPVEVDELLELARRAHGALAAARSLELRVTCPAGLPEVWADEDAVSRVLDNLIANALKFTARGSISLRAERDRDHVVVSVADTGCGVDPEDLPHMFERFWQARGTRHAGAGLGLAIVKGLVEAHGGRVWAESRRGEGSEVRFTLPVAPARPSSLRSEVERRAVSGIPYAR